MTDLMNGSRPTNPGTLSEVARNAIRRNTPETGKNDINAARKSGPHPKQAHLNSLIHTGIVTHLVYVDEGPDPLFAVAQMRDFAEVEFAAVFQEGLIALGCKGKLPPALATIAVPAVATAPARPEIAKGLERFESVSRRLETLVDSMEPEEVILSEQLGKSILNRLTALEHRIASPHPKQEDPALVALREKLDLIEHTLKATPDHKTTLAALDTKLAKIAGRPDPVIDLSEQNQNIEKFATVITMVVKRIETAAGEMKTALDQKLSGAAVHDTAISEQGFKQLGEHLSRLEHLITTTPSEVPELGRNIEDTLRTLVEKVQTALAATPGTEEVTERIEQLGAAQRTAFTRIETAMSKAVSGLEPALNHLNARAADTENMMSDWHKDLKTLSQHTRAIADTTGQLPAAFAALQTDVADFSNRPAPVLDLTAQQEGFAGFSEQLRHSLKEIETFSARVDEKTTRAAAQSDETLATLQTLPSLISAALRHDVDLTPLRDGISDLQTQLTALPGDMNLSAIASGVSALFDQLVPMNELHAADIKALGASVERAVAQITTLGEDITRLDAKDPGLAPLQDLLATLEKQLAEAAQQHDGQISRANDTLTDLARHLGAKSHQMTEIAVPSVLAPDTSLNTLRMEFADLISKRIKENGTTISGTQRQA